MHLVSVCYNRYSTILNKWLIVNGKYLTDISLNIITSPRNYCIDDIHSYGAWDVIRLTEILKLLDKGETIIQLDLDTVLFKPLNVLANMNYDLIFSRGECGEKCWPYDCSSILGFGICTGLYIAKPSSKNFLENVFTDMKNKRYGQYSDQLTIMNIFKNANLQWINEDVEINGYIYTNKVTYYMNIKICVIDFDMFERGLYFGLNKQFGNHFPIDKVGGVDNFCKVLDNIDNLKLYAKETFKYKPNIFSNEEINLIHSI